MLAPFCSVICFNCVSSHGPLIDIFCFLWTGRKSCQIKQDPQVSLAVPQRDQLAKPSIRHLVEEEPSEGSVPSCRERLFSLLEKIRQESLSLLPHRRPGGSRIGTPSLSLASPSSQAINFSEVLVKQATTDELNLRRDVR
jgi:hypothetical protein